MQIRIWHKLFLAILLVSAIIALLNSGLSYISFQRGYAAYIEKLQQAQLQRVALALQLFYQERGSWQPLRQNRRLWHRLMLRAERGEPIKGVTLPADKPLLVNKVGLLDSNRQPVAGRIHKHDQILPLILEGQVIGYLVTVSGHPLLRDIDKQFAQQQQRAFIVTGLFSLIIAALAALGLARLFNRPIRQLDQAVHTLASGDYRVQLHVKGRDELANLAQDVNLLATTLDNHQHARQQWIADISHELRTPLTVLRGEIEALEDGVRPFNPQALSSLALEVKQLTRLVEDLYQLSQADLGTLSYQKQPLDIRELLEPLLDSYGSRLQQQRLRLEYQPPTEDFRVFADHERLTQLFSNLLENSLRYTDAGGLIRIGINYAADGVNICIEDTVPGVPAEHLPHLFDRLYRVDRSRSRESGGSGLGLSIAQSIALAHEGRLHAKASPLGGLAVTLHLPLRES